jgi:hypothetical protein
VVYQGCPADLGYRRDPNGKAALHLVDDLDGIPDLDLCTSYSLGIGSDRSTMKSQKQKPMQQTRGLIFS